MGGIRKWQQEDVKPLTIQMSGMDMDAVSRKGHVCFFYPDSRVCAEKYGEGPDADYQRAETESKKKII